MWLLRRRQTQSRVALWNFLPSARPFSFEGAIIRHVCVELKVPATTWISLNLAISCNRKNTRETKNGNCKRKPDATSGTTAGGAYFIARRRSVHMPNETDRSFFNLDLPGRYQPFRRARARAGERPGRRVVTVVKQVKKVHEKSRPSHPAVDWCNSPSMQV